MMVGLLFMRPEITNGPDTMRIRSKRFQMESQAHVQPGLRYDLYRPTVDKYNHLAWVT